MTFTIISLHLYNADGDRRSIYFRERGLSIITGRSATGKSSILDIIDYCLGSSDYTVSAGAIRDTCRLYALELSTDDGKIVVARPAPTAGNTTSTRMHFGLRAEATDAPNAGDLPMNVDNATAASLLSRLLGITENVTDTGSGTRARFSASIRHSLYFCLQGQGEIANPSILFHKQQEEFVPQAIRDVLPYFLGAVDPQYLVKQDSLRATEQTLRALRRSIRDDQDIQGPSGRARSLLSEAQSVGLLAVDMAQIGDADVLSSLAAASVREAGELVAAPSDDRLRNLLEERESLRQSYSQARRVGEDLRRLVQYETSFAGEIGEQRARLTSLNLLRADEDSPGESCPLCDSALNRPITAASEIRNHLLRIEAELEGVAGDVPRAQQLLGESQVQLGDLADRLRENQEELRRSGEAQELFDTLRDSALARAAVRGRIRLFLESVSRATEDTLTRQRIAELELRVAALQADLDPDAAADRLASALSRVSVAMTAIARNLQLEHAPSPVRLDPRGLTVVVDTSEGAYRLGNIGSGENWLGYHIAALLGLHNLFVGDGRPLPRFLVLDQPSQVYFPPDARPDDEDSLADEDRAGLTRVYQQLVSFSDEAEMPFQMIVMDHADLQEDWFQEAVVERWRGGDALIPQAWINGNRPTDGLS